MSRFFDMFEAIDQRAPGVSSSRTWRPLSLQSGTQRSLFHCNGAYRTEVEKAVTQLYFAPTAPTPRVSVFLSLQEGVQLRGICAHLVDLLASQRAVSVCLVEADPDAPSLRQRLGLPELCGLTDLLTNTKLMLNEAVARVPETGVSLLTHGAPGPDNALFESDLFKERMEQIRQYFDLVLIDAPSARSWANTLALANQADGVVLVLQSGTGREVALQRKAELEGCGVTILGAILMDRPLPIPARNGKGR